MIVLEEITEENISLYSAFEFGDYKKYQSRIYPDEAADEKLWYYIKYDDMYIGTVWLEKFSCNDFAVLGIYIANEDCRNKGIGLTAIEIVLEKMSILAVDKVLLRVREDNKRAIKCYQKAGFIEKRRYVKANGIKAIEMIYTK